MELNPEGSLFRLKGGQIEIKELRQVDESKFELWEKTLNTKMEN